MVHQIFMLDMFCFYFLLANPGFHSAFYLGTMLRFVRVKPCFFLGEFTVAEQFVLCEIRCQLITLFEEIHGN